MLLITGIPLPRCVEQKKISDLFRLILLLLLIYCQRTPHKSPAPLLQKFPFRRNSTPTAETLSRTLLSSASTYSFAQRFEMPTRRTAAYNSENQLQLHLKFDVSLPEGRQKTLLQITLKHAVRMHGNTLKDPQLRCDAGIAVKHATGTRQAVCGYPSVTLRVL